MWKRRLSVVVASIAVLASATGYFIYSDGVERPPDMALLQKFGSHTGAFQNATCRLGTPTTIPSELSKLGVDFMSCDYDGTLRLGFSGSHLGLAIGPGWIKGITRFTGSPSRHGQVVSSTDNASKLPANIYLRSIQEDWYIFYQRDED